jgi:hypothetical protein
MAIYDHQYGELSYFRVFRAWGGEEHQEYVRIKRSRNAAYTKAKEIDARFEKAQKSYCLEHALLPEHHVRPDGHIRGLRRVLVKRKGRSPVDVFELRVNVPWESQIKRTTISISVHGAEKAFKLSVDKICQWYGLKPRSEPRVAMMACRELYLKKDLMDHGQLESLNRELLNEMKLVENNADENLSNVAEQAYQKAKDEIANLRGGFLKSIKRFTA